MTISVNERELQQVIDKLVREEKLERITTENGEPGIRLVKKEKSVSAAAETLTLFTPRD
jgi:hypothetical protein